MNYIERKKETTELQEVLSRDESSLVVVYGRRNLGKSTILKKVLSKNDIYFLASKVESRLQLRLFAHSVAAKFEEFSSVPFPDWETLLFAINNRATKRFTLVIDEFSFLVRQAPTIISTFQRLIDSGSLRFNIVLCGSAIQAMTDLFQPHTAPLYGRADLILPITPIPIELMAKYLRLIPQNCIEEYAVWGGTIANWHYRDGSYNINDAIKRNLEITGEFGSILPTTLFRDDIRDLEKSITIISHIAEGATRLVEIASRCGEAATNLSRPLSKLISLGYIERIIPYGERGVNPKKSHYKICDPFMNFYFKFIFPNRSFLEIKHLKPLQKRIEAELPDVILEFWKSLVISHVSYNSIDNIAFGEARPWWEKSTKEQTTTLDIVAQSLDKSCFLVGDCFWNQKEKAEKQLENLKSKVSEIEFLKDKKIIYKIFLKQKSFTTSNETISASEIIKI